MMARGTPEDFLGHYGTSERFVPPGLSAEDDLIDDRWDEQEAAYGRRPPDDETRQANGRSREKAQGSNSSEIIPKLVFPSSLRGLPIPEMEWIIDGWIPIGDVTLLYGDGGVGKTLLAQELMASTAIGAPWCTLPARRCKSLGVFCEDDDGELHRRQDSIQRFLGTDFDDARMDNMAWWCRKGEDNLLCTLSRSSHVVP